MTTARIARVGKFGRSRFIIGIGILIVIVGLLAIFHSSRQQLDEARLVSIRIIFQMKLKQPMLSNHYGLSTL